MDDDAPFLSAKEAAALLGVSLNTLYVYVSRKGLRSQPIEGTRERKYWKADLLRLKHGDRADPAISGELKRESALTLVTDQGHHYRGRSAVELSETQALEAMAGILWSCPVEAAFGPQPLRAPPTLRRWTKLLAEESSVDRALSLLPRLEQADVRAYDLSPLGMARTGADVVRWMTAITLRQGAASSLPIHEQVAQALELDEGRTALVRRLLVLAADHGFEPAAYAVRAVASTGVSPWRAVMTGLLVVLGRRSGFGRFETLRLFLSELAQGNPHLSVTRRLRDGEPVPGFGSRLYSHGDPRARVLLAHCFELFGDRPLLRHLAAASALMRDANGLEPDFALACMVVAELLDTSLGASLFPIGRSVGWVAHAIEQYAAGEIQHLDGLYVGPLPRPPASNRGRRPSATPS